MLSQCEVFFCWNSLCGGGQFDFDENENVSYYKPINTPEWDQHLQELQGELWCGLQWPVFPTKRIKIMQSSTTGLTLRRTACFWGGGQGNSPCGCGNVTKDCDWSVACWLEWMGAERETVIRYGLVWSARQCDFCTLLVSSFKHQIKLDWTRLSFILFQNRIFLFPNFWLFHSWWLGEAKDKKASSPAEKKRVADRQDKRTSQVADRILKASEPEVRKCLMNTK